MVSLNYNVGAVDSDPACGRDFHVPCVTGSLKQSWNKLKHQR